MQLIDSTATEMGVKNVWDPRQNIMGGARYLQSMMTRFAGRLENAVASYNAGPGQWKNTAAFLLTKRHACTSTRCSRIYGISNNWERTNENQD